jgi:hypothetical protein
MKIIFILLLSVAISSCSSVDGTHDYRYRTYNYYEPFRSLNRYPMSDFYYIPAAPTMHYKMRAWATVEYPNNKPEAEAVRIEWLEKYLREEKLCGNGYEILSRTRTFEMWHRSSLQNPGDENVSSKEDIIPSMLSLGVNRPVPYVVYIIQCREETNEER